VLAPPWLIALALVLGLLVLVPARRLREAGLSRGSVGVYIALLWGVAMLVAIRPGATRLLIPILLLGYLAPFIASPDLIGRILGRRPRPGDAPPIKNVTPPDPPPLPPESR